MDGVDWMNEVGGKYCFGKRIYVSIKWVLCEYYVSIVWVYVFSVIIVNYLSF